MSKLVLMCAAVAGLSLFGLEGNAEASHRCNGPYGGGYGRAYSSPGFRGGYYAPRPGYGYYNSPYRGGYHGGYGYSRGYYNGYRGGYRAPSFGIQTQGFGLYIR